MDPFTVLQKQGLGHTLQDAEHWHEMELQNLSTMVGRLETELREVHSETQQQQQRTCEHLLAHKNQLQRLVVACHKLLDREESRFVDFLLLL